MDVQMPDGTIISDVPDDITQSDLLRRYNLMSEPQGESGFLPALQANTSELKANAALLAGRAGFMDTKEAERIAAEERAYQAKTFKPTEKGWTEAPGTKFGELIGGSVPFMVAPIVAGVGALALPEELAGAATVAGGSALLDTLGLGTVGQATAAGLTGIASGAQFTGSNLARQMEGGKSLEQTNLAAAVGAAIPQAALDVFSLHMIPGVRNIFGEAGEKLTNEAAQKMAEQGIVKTIGDYALSTGKAATSEGLTEAAQQVFERMQAGLSLTDPDAQQEYIDNFMGGAILGGALAPVGRFGERAAAKSQAAAAAKEEEAKQEKEQPEVAQPVPQPVPQAAQPAPETPQPTPSQLVILPETEKTVTNQQLTSQDFQAMQDELDGKEITNAPSSTETANQAIVQYEPPAAPVEKKAEEPVVEEPKKPEIKPVEAPVEPPKAEEIKPAEKAPKLPPKVEQVASVPTGENTDYHVLKTPTGYTANMFDNDAGKYVPGSARTFSNKTFGDEAQAKAIDFANEQAAKAAKFNPPVAAEEKPVEAPKLEAPAEIKAPEVKPQIAVAKSALTPTPVINNISKEAVEAINTANDYSRQLADLLPTAADPNAHQAAIDRLNSTSENINEKGQIAANELARTNDKTPGEQNRDIQSAQADLNKALIEHRKAVLDARKLVGDIKTKEVKPEKRNVRPPIEEMPVPEDPEVTEAHERIKLAKQDQNKAKRLSYSLWTALKGSLNSSNVADLGDGYSQLKAGRGKQGVDLSSLVHSTALNDFLPHNMRPGAATYDEQQSVEEIKNRLLQKNYVTYDAQMEIEGHIGTIREAEDLIQEHLKLKEINELINQAADEQRESEINSRVVEPEGEAGAAPTSAPELTLQGETPEEVRAKETAKEERAKTEREAENKAEIDKGVGEFTLTGSNRPADVAAARGQTGLFDTEPEKVKKETVAAPSIGNEKQLLLIADESNKLTDNEKSVLEEEYGVKHGSNEFLERLHNDVFSFITKGAGSVKNKIRGIINKIANSLLSVAMVLNPNFVTKPEIVAVPQYETRVETVYAEVPAEAKAKMSPAAQQIYSVVYPTLKDQLIKNNKFFIVTDKPMARNFIFNPDGSLLMDKKVLLSKSIGDFLPEGSNEIDANKITPAGLYDLGLRDASRSKGEAETAGEYDYGKVFVIEHAGEGRHGPYSMTIMHSVWTHEKDAAQRLAALKTEAPNVSRYSFGCINVDKATFGELVNNHLSQMDGAKLFIVPDSATNAMDFVNGKATYREDMLRQRVEPLTKEIKTPVKEAAKTEGEKLVGKEEETPRFYHDIIPFSEFEEKKKRSPSFKRAVTELNKGRNKGMLTDEEFALRVGDELEADNNRKSNKPIAARKRGILHIKARLNSEAARGVISKEAVDLAEWFMNQNPSLVDDLGISIKEGERGTGGYYDNLLRVFSLMKNAGSDETPVHEILHHTERMMPKDIQAGIQKEWLQQLVKAQKNAKTDAEKVYFAALMDGHFGENRALDIEVKDKNGNVDKSVNKFLYDTIMRAKEQGQTLSSLNLAKYLLQYSGLPMSNYRFMNPSEFWAVNGSRIVAGDYAAIQGTRLDRLKNWLGKLAEKIKSLFGFRSDAPILKALQSLSKSDGKFQTKDMLGGGEYQNITQNYAGKPAPKSEFDLGDDTKLDKFLHDWVDKYKEIKDVIKLVTQTGKDIDDRFNAYQKEELYHKKVATKIKMFLNNELRPIITSMAKYKITVAQLEEFLHMRHAEERNDWIAQRNPNMPDGGSGIKTADARKYLADLAKDPAREKALNELGDRIDKMVYNNQEELVRGGIETQATIDALRKQFKHYVPLERADVDFANSGTGLGAGYSTKGSSFKHAFGSTKQVINIFENLALQRERSIIRSEKAVVGRAIYGMALRYPNPKFWLPVNPDAIKNKQAFINEILAMGGTRDDAYNLMQEPKVAGFDKNGQVVYRVNAGLRNSRNVFPVRINGRDRYVFFNPSDAKAMRMAESLKNLDTEQLDMVMGTIGNITRIMAAFNTQYNPVFGLWNFSRDTGGAAFNLTTTPIAHKKAQVMKDTLPALKGIFQYLRDERNGVTNQPNYKPSKWAAAFKDYQEAGGGVGFKEQFSRGKGDLSIIEKEMKNLNKGNVRKVADSFFNLLSDYNDAMENAVRLSTYQTALDEGLSKDKAASISKNITVNFNRKGAKTPYASALYAFFNASVQGSARLLETLQGPAGRKIMVGGLSVGVIQAMILAAAGYDDDEPPEYLKDKNFVIPLPGGNYALIPMPLGINMFPGVGRIVTESIFRAMGVISGSEGPGKKMTDIAGLIADTFNPLGSGSMLQSLSPTVADPLLAVATNKDAFGRPIYREDRATNPTPGYTRSREGATAVSKVLAEFMNYVSGGDKYQKGAYSPTADELDYLAGQYGGGAIREALKAVEAVKAPFSDQELPSYRIPILGKMYGETESPAAIQDKFYKNVTLMAGHENEIKGMIKDKQNISGYLKENPEAKLWSTANGLENAVNSLNKQRRMLSERNAPQAQIDRINAQKVRMMKQFNDRVSRLETQ